VQLVQISQVCPMICGKNTLKMANSYYILNEKLETLMKILL